MLTTPALLLGSAAGSVSEFELRAGRVGHTSLLTSDGEYLIEATSDPVLVRPAAPELSRAHASAARDLGFSVYWQFHPHLLQLACLLAPHCSSATRAAPASSTSTAAVSTVARTTVHVSVNVRS